jgi:preprotein translocase subunit SecD
LVTPPAKQVANAQIILTDRQRIACYLLGPTLLTGTNIGSADAVENPTSSAWYVNVHFTNDDFVKKVATVEQYKQIAIVLDGVVEATPTIQPGIAGQDVVVSGPFNEVTAREVAARIDPSSRSRSPQTTP